MNSFAFEHFLEAQEQFYPRVLEELRAGRKQSHWMWFIFPQLRGLGASSMAQRFGLADLNEAKTYAAHERLGARLRECVSLVNLVEERSAEQIFGFPDVLKFRSCLTLFDRATHETAFKTALDRFYAGEPDARTLALLGLD